MHSAFLYIVTILIWGSTWIAIKYQLGTVDALVSIGHRMALATILSVLLASLTQGLSRIRFADHRRIAAQAFFLFSGNYVLIYAATASLSSGLVAVVFSTMVVLNAVGGALFLDVPLRPGVLFGGLLGMLGMAGLFLPELESFSWSDSRLQALGLCFLGTVFASAGNMVAAANIRAGIPVLTTNSWGMFYGAVISYVIALLFGRTISVDWQFSYLASLLYLSFVGTVLAFWAYISLLGRIGADRAAYTTLLFPIVALLISWAFEDYRWSVWGIAGFALVLTGNWLAMRGVRH